MRSSAEDAVHICRKCKIWYSGPVCRWCNTTYLSEVVGDVLATLALFVFIALLLVLGGL